LTLRCHTGVG